MPRSILETIKRKEVRKQLNRLLKQIESQAASGQKQLSMLQAKIHYLNVVAQLPSYGAKCFPVKIKVDKGNFSLLFVFYD